MRKGILLTENFDIAINPVRDTNGLITSGIIVGNSEDQDAILILTSQQGNIKEDPLLGVGLNKFIRSKYNSYEIQSRIRLHLTRAGIDYDNFKERLILNINNSN